MRQTFCETSCSRIAKRKCKSIRKRSYSLRAFYSDAIWAAAIFLGEGGWRMSKFEDGQGKSSRKQTQSWENLSRGGNLNVFSYL